MTMMTSISTNPQLQANYILSSIERFRKEAEELCKNNEIRLPTRVELVNQFGIQLADASINEGNFDAFKFFKYDENQPMSKDVMIEFRSISRDFKVQEGSIEEIALRLYDKMHFKIMNRTGDEVLADDVANLLSSSVLEAFLEKFIAYIYTHDYGGGK